MEDKDKYKIESAMNTLLRAEEIKKDKNLIAKVMKMMGKKQENISEVLRNSALKVSKK